MIDLYGGFINFATFDFETKKDKSKNIIYSVAYFNGQEVETCVNKFKTNDEYINWLFEAIDREIVYAHFGGGFDFLYIMNYIIHNKIKIEKFILIHGIVAIIKIKFNKKTITFKDSYLILPHSLKSLTTNFKVAHQKLEFDYSKNENNLNFNEYIENDVIGLYEVLKFSNLTDRLTIASNSINIFKKDFYIDKFGKMSRNKDSIDNFFRKSYFGGRVELIKTYGQNLYYYDINSLYPYVMLKYKYPLIQKDNYIKSNELDKKNNGIYQCILKSDYIYIPILPHKDVKNKKLLFPYGKFKGTYTTNELLLAEKMGYNIEIIKGYTFNEYENIFNDYVDYYYNIKKNSEGSKKEIAKLMLNSLYGKFAQKRHYTNSDLDFNSKEIEGKLQKTFLNGILKETKKYDKYSQFMHSEIGSMITSNARIELYNLINRAGQENVYYYDTDSLITSKCLNTDTNLGGIKKVADINEFVGISAKLYAYINDKGEAHITAKGFNVKDLKFNNFLDAHQNNNLASITTKKESIRKFKSSLRCSDTIGDIYDLVRCLKKPYSKRLISNDKINTEPIKILDI